MLHTNSSLWALFQSQVVVIGALLVATIANVSSHGGGGNAGGSSRTRWSVPAVNYADDQSADEESVASDAASIASSVVSGGMLFAFRIVFHKLQLEGGAPHGTSLDNMK